MKLPDPRIFVPAVFIVTIIFYVFMLSITDGKTLTASWYSVGSCLLEGGTGIMANGEMLDDKKFTAASWDYSFGTNIKVINLINGESVTVKICDRGPNRRLYRQGRVIDLSKAAFAQIADLKIGVIPIRIEEVKDGVRRDTKTN